jgi:uncharacterized protein
MKKILPAIALGLAVHAAQCAANAASIAVVGQSDVEAMPDVATLTFEVRSANKDAVKTQAENVAVTKKLLEQLKTVGLQDRELRTSNYAFGRDARPGKDGNIIELGFYAENTIEIKTSHFEFLPQLVATAISNGATSIGDAVYSLSDEKSVLDKARVIAFKNADDEARLSATSAGMQLGPITKVAVGAAAISNQLAGIGGMSSRKMVSYNRSDLKPNLSVTFVHVEYNVTIEYELK